MQSRLSVKAMYIVSPFLYSTVSEYGEILSRIRYSRGGDVAIDFLKMLSMGLWSVLDVEFFAIDVFEVLFAGKAKHQCFFLDLRILSLCFGQRPLWLSHWLVGLQERWVQRTGACVALKLNVFVDVIEPKNGGWQ